MVEPVSSLSSRMAVNLDSITAPVTCQGNGSLFQTGPDSSASRRLTDTEIADAAKVSWQSQLRNEVQ